MADYLKIHDFAVKYQTLYENPQTTEEELATDFAEQCLAFGFNADRGESCIDMFWSDPSYTSGTLSPRCIGNAMLLGDAIFFRWVCVTHGADFTSLLLEINRKWFATAFKSLSVIALEAHNYQFRFKGVLCKIQISSYHSYFLSQPAPEDEAMQRITILGNGRVWLSRYNYGNIRNERNMLIEKKQFRIAPRSAEAIMKSASDYFSNGYDGHYATDVGIWELTLTNTDGETFKTSGSLISGEKDLDALSDMIRTELGRRDLLVFDGTQDSITT